MEVYSKRCTDFAVVTSFEVKVLIRDWIGGLPIAACSNNIARADRVGTGMPTTIRIGTPIRMGGVRERTHTTAPAASKSFWSIRAEAYRRNWARSQATPSLVRTRGALPTMRRSQTRQTFITTVVGSAQGMMATSTQKPSKRGRWLRLAGASLHSCLIRSKSMFQAIGFLRRRQFSGSPKGKR